MEAIGQTISLLVLSLVLACSIAHPNGSRGPPSHSHGKPNRPLTCAADQVVTTVNNQQECQCQNDDAMFHRVIWPKDRKCYSLNTKGPCKSGEWMVLNNDQPICKTTFCTVDGLHLEISWSNGTVVCGKLGQQGTCPERHVLKRSNNEVFCVVAPSTAVLESVDISVSAIGLAPNRCGANERLTPNGICKAAF